MLVSSNTTEATDWPPPSTVTSAASDNAGTPAGGAAAVLAASRVMTRANKAAEAAQAAIKLLRTMSIEVHYSTAVHATFSGLLVTD